MFRRSRGRPPSARTSPHARGDVPAVQRWSSATHAFSPRPWGCSDSPVREQERIALLPTPVGMFRFPTLRSPVTRTSPHARGDVPSSHGGRAARSSFSPRPWGCSVERNGGGSGRILLPTPVGMFRYCPLSRNSAQSSPHARGDVPSNAVNFPPPWYFSPRPWGCSGYEPLRRDPDGLLPTPVGMFRAITSVGITPRPSPHARGDVPYRAHLENTRNAFSPRPWGCSGSRHGLNAATRLLPTPVGMFRAPPRSPRRSSPSPHARGDVPCADRVQVLGRLFSPRPWGCSGRSFEARRSASRV